MIYIWDNGGEYSDHRIYFIDSQLSRDEIVRVLPFSWRSWGEDPGHLIAEGQKLDWIESSPCSIVAVVKVDAFFAETPDPSPDPAAPHLYQGGPYKNEADELAAERRRWAAAKYKWHFDEGGDGRHRAQCGDPVGERFAVLTAASARELIAGWRVSEIASAIEPMVSSFEAECQERKILPTEDAQ